MIRLRNSFWLVSAVLIVAGCGGSTNTGGGGPTTPTVTVSASPASITTAQSTTVTVTVSGTSGTPTGSVTLTSGSYSSGAQTLTNGTASITISAGTLAAGPHTLTASYASTSSSYNNASGSGSVTVTSATLLTPTVTVSPSPASITTAQSTTVTVTVSGTGATPTGSITLSSGTYNSGAKTLVNGSVQVTVQGSALATATDTLTAAYTPDAGSSSVYNSASGTGSVTVTAPSLLTPTVTVTPNPSSITTAQSTTVTITVSGTGATPTGSITLSSGTYNSGAKTLVGGSVQVTVQGSALATATDTLTAAYTPDAGSSSVYNSASGTGSVTVTAPTLLTPTITVSPSPASITTAQSTTVTVTVSGGSGNPVPTGSITLTSGSYNSGAKTLVGGSVTVTVQGSALATATDTLTAAYTPDAGSSSTYNSATGTGSVTVTSATQTTPTVTVTPNPSSIGSAQSTMITVTVSGGGSNPTPTGSITLTSGSYNSGAQTLVGGSVTITVQGSALANGTDLVHAAYTPDSGSSSIYNSATGVTTVTVTGSLSITSFTASPNPIPAGSSSTQLTAVFAGGTGVITPGNISVTTNVPVTVSPTATTTYTLTVTPTSGSPITQNLTVTVLIGATVDFTTTHQTIRGFGGASVWLGQMSSAVATALFGSGPNDLNLSILRVRIDPTGSASSTPPWVTTNGSGWSVEAANGKAAVQNNPNAIVFASPWTPPAVWKLNGSSVTDAGVTVNEAYNSSCGLGTGFCGGYLDPAHYADYANYLEDFVKYFNANAGTNLYAVSMQNEPDFNANYESCVWTPDQMDTWVAGNASIITSDAYSTKFIMPESESFNPKMAAPTLNDSSAQGQVSVVAGHIYGVQPSSYSIPVGDSPKELWMTEFGPLSNTPLTFAGALAPYGVDIHNSLVNGSYNAFVWWGFFGNAPGTCSTNAGTCGFVDSTGALQPMGEIIGQYSKFIQPGYVRASATANPTSGVLASAYTGSSGGAQHYVIVVINTNASPVSLTFTLNGGVTSMTPYQSTVSAGLAAQTPVTVTSGQFNYTLPATSITTFVQ